MALDFPDSPSDGDYYEGFQYNSTSQTWSVRRTIDRPAVVSSTSGSPTIATVGGYTYYAYTGDGTITFSEAGLVSVMCIGGGANGVNIYGVNAGGGGGGAGGVHSGSVYVPAQTLVVEIGAGGSGASALEGVAYGLVGGKASGGNDGTGGNGGSGSGAGVPSNTIGLGTIGQGNDGGQSTGSEGGGGGGAGAAGNANGQGTGGTGTAEFSAWGIATSTGEDVGGVHYFAGGGGGGGATNTGGDGGGGDGRAGSSTPTAGLANTGGGGGSSQRGGGGAGGSGIVIVRVG